MGMAEKVLVFFKEIGLKIGKREDAAMKARGRSAHGGSGSAADFTELVQHGVAFRTLFERVFLQVLGYAGTYVDRTTLHFPNRPIDEPAGGE
jgi:hypothetical protein